MGLRCAKILSKGWRTVNMSLSYAISIKEKMAVPSIRFMDIIKGCAQKLSKTINTQRIPDGGWAVSLKETGSPKAAVFFFNTDTKTTEIQFATLTDSGEGEPENPFE